MFSFMVVLLYWKCYSDYVCYNSILIASVLAFVLGVMLIVISFIVGLGLWFLQRCGPGFSQAHFIFCELCWSHALCSLLHTFPWIVEIGQFYAGIFMV